MAGNHDYDTVVLSKTLRGTADDYLANVGPNISYFQGKSWFGDASANGLNTYHTFNDGGRTYMMLSLEHDVPDSAMAWAQGILDAHPATPTIVTTHNYVDASGIPNSAYSGNADSNTSQYIRDNLILTNPQIFMTLNGHWHGPENTVVSTNVRGMEVYQMLSNYQDRTNGGNGWMRIITFDEDNSQIRVETYSPTLDQFETDADSQFTFNVNFAHRFDFAPTVTYTFRQGENGYNDALDTHIGDGSEGVTGPNEDNSATTNIRIDSDEDNEQGLLRFDNFIGTGPGQVAPGTQIVSATLTFTTQGDFADSPDGARFHRMLIDWQDSDTWNDFIDGIAADER